MSTDPTYPAYTGTFYTYPLSLSPAVTVPSPSRYAKKIENMKKLYKNDMKYSKNNDNFVHKLSIFHHFCDKSNIPYEIRSKTFSSMFKSFAFDYYLTNVNMLKHVSLNQLCIFICTHFEKSINVKNNRIKWNQITLKSIMSKQKNEGKSMIDCLNILVNELRHLQHDLNFELQNETFM